MPGPFYDTIAQDPSMRAYYEYIQTMMQRPGEALDPQTYFALLAQSKSYPDQILSETMAGNTAGLRGRLPLASAVENADPRASRLEKIYQMLGSRYPGGR